MSENWSAEQINILQTLHAEIRIYQRFILDFFTQWATDPDVQWLRDWLDGQDLDKFEPVKDPEATPEPVEFFNKITEGL